MKVTSDTIVVYEKDGNVCVVRPSKEVVKREMPLDLFVQISVPKDTPHHIMDKKDLPKYDEYRNAWVIKGDKVEIDSQKKTALREKLEARS